MRWFSILSEGSLASAWEATRTPGSPRWEELPLVDRERFRKFVAFATDFHRLDVAQKAQRAADLKVEAQLREMLRQIDAVLKEDDRG